MVVDRKTGRQKLSLNEGNYALKIGGGRQKDRQTDRQKDRQTDKVYSILSSIHIFFSGSTTKAFTFTPPPYINTFA